MPKNCFGLDCSCGAWHHDAMYDKYWDHYNMVRDWFSRNPSVLQNCFSEIQGTHSSLSHQHDHRRVNNKKSTAGSNEPYKKCSKQQNSREPTISQPFKSYGHKQSSCRKSHLKEKSVQSGALRADGKSMATRKLQNGPFCKPEDSELDELSDDSEEEENSDLVLDQSFIDFIHASEKYRNERDAKKESEDVEYVDIAKLSVDEFLEQSRQVPDKQHMEKLYGSKAGTVIAMQTAAMCSFDWCRNQNKNLKAWPYIPLNLDFNS